jgi:hypothetical protein
MIRGALTVGLALWVAALAAQAVKPDAVRIAQMHEQYRQVMVVQSAVTRGDLEAVRAPARLLAAATTPRGLPDAMSRHAVAMTAAASQAATAPNLTGAAHATATMLSECGTCHLDAGTRPAISDTSTTAVGGIVGHMIDHQRAIDQLQRGLMIPSSSDWIQGARGLRAAPLHRADLPPDPKLTGELRRVEEAVHRLAEDAVSAELTATRVRVFSTLLSRCADCHSLHKRIWGPK